jgi:hypothetical protein
LTHTYDDMTLDELRRRVDDWAHYGIEPSTPREWYIARRARRDAILDLQEALDAEGLVVVPAAHVIDDEDIFELTEEESREFWGKMEDAIRDAALINTDNNALMRFIRDADHG